VRAGWIGAVHGKMGPRGKNSVRIPYPLSLNEFTDEQIALYLEKTGLKGVVPRWLPTRPLLVGYLAAKGLLGDLLSSECENIVDEAEGWDRLLDGITQREAEIEAGIDGSTVRKLLERLATYARATPGGLGPIAREQLMAAFADVCGYSPDERGMILLQRLPGLGIDKVDEETRVFIDHDYADVCRSGDILDFIESPYTVNEDSLRNIECASGLLAISIIARKSVKRSYSEKKINAALKKANESIFIYVATDISRAILDIGLEIKTDTYIDGVYVPELELTNDMGNGAKLCFRDCLLGRVGIDPEVPNSKMPKFQTCYIGEVDGRLSVRDLPSDVFDSECIIDDFSTQAETTSAILDLDLPLGTRVLMTVLKKLYQRKGRGRKENALHRGLDHQARRLVPDVLKLLHAEDLATPYRRGDMTIWLPNRIGMSRVGKIISSPSGSSDPLLVKSAELD
jgi:hypothetical protein